MTGGRQYIDFDPRKGYPAGPDLFYECGICGDVIPSMPDNAAACRCGNVLVDADSGRVSVREGEKLRIFRK